MMLNEIEPKPRCKVFAIKMFGCFKEFSFLNFFNINLFLLVEFYCISENQIKLWIISEGSLFRIIPFFFIV